MPSPAWRSPGIRGRGISGQSLGPAGELGMAESAVGGSNDRFSSLRLRPQPRPSWGPWRKNLLALQTQEGHPSAHVFPVISHLTKPILHVGKLSPGRTLTPPGLQPRALPQPRLVSRPWARRLRRHVEEALRELRRWGSGICSGSGSGSGSRSGEGSGSEGGHEGETGPCPLSQTRSCQTQGG